MWQKSEGNHIIVGALFGKKAMGLLQRLGSKCGKTQSFQSHWDLCFLNCKLGEEGCRIDHRGEILHSPPVRLCVPCAMCILPQGPESLWYHLKGGWSKPLNGPKDRPQWAWLWSIKNHTFLCVLEWVSKRANTCYGARNGAREQCGVSNLVECCEQREQPDFRTLKIILSHELEIEWMSEQISERRRAWAKQAVPSRQTEWAVGANKRTDEQVAP